MILDILGFVFSSFWTFGGCFLFSMLIMSFVVNLAKAICGK